MVRGKQLRSVGLPMNRMGVAVMQVRSDLRQIFQNYSGGLIGVVSLRIAFVVFCLASKCLLKDTLVTKCFGERINGVFISHEIFNELLVR